MQTQNELASAIDTALEKFKAALQELKVDAGDPANASVVESLKALLKNDPRTALFNQLGNAIYELEGCKRHLRQLGSGTSDLGMVCTNVASLCLQAQ